MLSHNTTPHHITNQQRHPLDAAAMRRLERPTQAELATRHWICIGCGTAHSVILPEECQTCGATALEFEYASASEMEARM
jgi:rubrerythrin